MPKKRLPDGMSKSDKKTLIIASAAAKLFSVKGYVETSMDDIAAAAKISKGGIYHYFGSKGVILRHILSTFMDAVLEDLEQDMERIDEPLQRIRLLVFRHVKTYSEHMYMAKALLHEAHNLSSAGLREIKSKEKRYFAAIAGTLSLYLGQGVGKETLTVLTFNLLGMCNWIYSWYNPKGALSPERLSQMIFDTFTKELGSFRKIS